MSLADGSSNAKSVTRRGSEQAASPYTPIRSPNSEQVVASAQRLLRQSPYRALHHVNCEFHEGIMTLRGQVASFYLKQVAQTTVRGVYGIGVISNRLEVVG